MRKTVHVLSLELHRLAHDYWLIIKMIKLLLLHSVNKYSKCLSWKYSGLSFRNRKFSKLNLILKKKMFSLFICSVFMLLFIYIPKSTTDIYRSVFSFNSFKYKLFIIFQKSVIVKFTKNYLSFNFPCCFSSFAHGLHEFFSHSPTVFWRYI